MRHCFTQNYINFIILYVLFCTYLITRTIPIHQKYNAFWKWIVFGFVCFFLPFYYTKFTVSSFMTSLSPLLSFDPEQCRRLLSTWSNILKKLSMLTSTVAVEPWSVLKQQSNWPSVPAMLWTNNENWKHFCDSHIDGLVWGGRGSGAFTLELYFFCIEPSMWPLTVNRTTLNWVMNCWYFLSVLLLVLTHWGHDEIAFICRQHFAYATCITECM